MSASGRPPLAGAQTGLLRALMGAVRPEFRSDVLSFAADDPVFGGGRVLGHRLRSSARGRGLCQSHYLRWVTQGRPDLEI